MVSPPTRPDAPVPATFVTGGVRSAVEQARAVAGEGWAGVAGPSIAQQCLDAGLLDEIRINLVPVLFGTGIRYFGGLAGPPCALEGPSVIEGDGVTHLRYRVPGSARRRTASTTSVSACAAASWWNARCAGSTTT